MMTTVASQRTVCTPPYRNSFPFNCLCRRVLQRRPITEGVGMLVVVLRESLSKASEGHSGHILTDGNAFPYGIRMALLGSVSHKPKSKGALQVRLQLAPLQGHLFDSLADDCIKFLATSFCIQTLRPRHVENSASTPACGKRNLKVDSTSGL